MIRQAEGLAGNHAIIYNESADMAERSGRCFSERKILGFVLLTIPSAG